MFTYYANTNLKIKKQNTQSLFSGLRECTEIKKFTENVKYKRGRRKSCNSSNESLHQGEKKS